MIHQTSIAMSQSVPAEIDAGADVILKVNVSCPEGCDLRGLPIRVLGSGEVVCAAELATYQGANETENFAVKVPGQAGEHAWTILFQRHEIEDTVHEESCLVVSFKTRPHTTSMAVWDIPAPVVTNRSFRVKVGVKCSATCQLVGQLIEVRDEEGTQIGVSKLGETAWPGTNGLYVADLELRAPATEGIRTWSAAFVPVDCGLPHERASAAFGFRTARAPEHRVAVRVTDKETRAPLESVEVHLGIYRALTDAHGLTSLELPGGVYDLVAWKVGYQTPSTTVDVGKDLEIEIEALFSPEKDPDDERVWM